MLIWSKDEMRKDIARLDKNINKIKKRHFRGMVKDIIDKHYQGIDLSSKQKNVLIIALTEIQNDIK